MNMWNDFVFDGKPVYVLEKSENAWKCFENDANDHHGGDIVQSHILVSL
jgi:hypothetical protein